MHRSVSRPSLATWLEVLHGNSASSAGDLVAAELPSCEFKAADGRLWRVRELRTADGASLLFEADRIARRVRDFPAGWVSLSPPELEELSWHR